MPRTVNKDLLIKVKDKMSRNQEGLIER